MKLRALRVAAALAVLPLILSGCDVLLAGLYGMDPFGDPFADPFADPSVVTTYDSGTTTIEFTQGGETQTITLDQVAANSQLDSLYGATVNWENDDGWSTSVTAYDTAQFGDGMGMPGVIAGDVTISLINGHDYWMAGSYTSSAGHSCIVDVWEMSETKFSGRANCRELQWTDGVAPYNGSGPAYIEGEEPFDVSITFEATPIGNDQTS
jgi:hypothetical protein